MFEKKDSCCLWSVKVWFRTYFGGIGINKIVKKLKECYNVLPENYANDEGLQICLMASRKHFISLVLFRWILTILSSHQYSCSDFGATTRSKIYKFNATTTGDHFDPGCNLVGFIHKLFLFTFVNFIIFLTKVINLKNFLQFMTLKKS